VKLRRLWSRHRWPGRLGIVTGTLIALVVIVVYAASFWFDVTATSVTFVNDIGRPIAIPDCSTDQVEIKAGTTVKVPIAADHSPDCTLDDEDRGRVIGCVSVPAHLNNSTVIRLSDNHPPPCH
jgi:hypothetical protein